MAGYTKGTVKDFPGFDARADAEALRKAMKGLGTDEEGLLKILPCRSNAQRQEIAAAFKTLFGRDLAADLKSELTGKFDTLMAHLMIPAKLYDAHALKHAIKGAGTDEKVLTEILASRTPAEIQNIKQVYEEEYEANLEDHITSDTSGYYQRMLVVLLQDFLGVLAFLCDLQQAALTQCWTEVLRACCVAPSFFLFLHVLGAPRNSAQCCVKGAYLPDPLATCQNFKKANRDPDGRVNDELVEQDAQELFRAGELKWGTDEEKFITILGTRSISHLRKVFDKYMTISGFQIEETIDRETSGALEKLLLAIVKCVRSVPAYFAETLYYAMKGAGTDDDTLIRVMVSRSEKDLLDVRREFRKNFAKSLSHAIQKDTSGDYRKALLLLCGGEDD